MARQISGFSLLPVSYSPSATHYLYLKAHNAGKKASNSIPGGRTLFVVNVPPDATQAEMISLFKIHGPIEKIVLNSSQIDNNPVQDDDGAENSDIEVEEIEENTENVSTTKQKPSKNRSKKPSDVPKRPVVTPLPTFPLRNIRPSGKSAYIIFVNESSVQQALSATQSTSTTIHWPSSSEPRGLARYTALHDNLRPPLSVVREHADTSLELYDYEQAQKNAHLKSQYKKGEAIVDEDGFTLVTRGGAYGQTVGGGIAVASKKFEQTGVASESGRKKKKLPKEKEKFYAFQLHEKKRDELIKLKRDWEADKAKVSKLRQERKFKPY